MQKLGQHFLKDEAALKKIAAALDPRDGETIIEIGPGHGELTAAIFAQNKNVNVVAIERDKNLPEELRARFKDFNFDLYEGDALKILPELSKKFGKYKLVGNIPYYITGFLFRTIGSLENKPSASVFTIQKEVGERLAAKPPQMNRLAASVQFWAEPKILFIIPRGSFVPPPKVESAAIILKTKPSITGEKQYYETVHALFQQPRKTVLNNLSAKFGKELSSKILLEVYVKTNERPQNVPLEKIIEISGLITLEKFQQPG
jgi:16S rRNA (adenine1518-N6/adenine1519-N6)-dimethyltransferase